MTSNCRGRAAQKTSERHPRRKIPPIVPAKTGRFSSALSAPRLPDEFTGLGQVFHDLLEVFVVSFVKVADYGITCLVGLCY